MPPQLYLYSYDTAGYALDSTGVGYNFEQLFDAGASSVAAAAIARNDPDAIYVFTGDGDTFARSTDAGQNWSILAPVAGLSSGQIRQMVAHVAGDLHVFQPSTSGGHQGIWRSTNGGINWTHILTMPVANQGGRGGWLAAGNTKLWFAESNTPQEQRILGPTGGSVQWDGTPIESSQDKWFIATFASSQPAPDQLWFQVTRIDAGITNFYFGWAPQGTTVPPDASPGTAPLQWWVGPINAVGTYVATVNYTGVTNPWTYWRRTHVEAASYPAVLNWSYTYTRPGVLWVPTYKAFYDIKTCNWDGTGVSTLATVDVSMPSTAGSAAQRLKLRAINDNFCLAIGNSGMPKLIKIASSGTVTDITPSNLRTYDACIFDASTYVAVGADLSGSIAHVRVWRTTNGGTSWTLVQTIPEEEGFVATGDDDAIVLDVVHGSTSAAYMVGHAAFDVRQFIWTTVDGGQTWTSFRNQSAKLDSGGDFHDYAPGGVLAVSPAVIEPSVAVPSRLATIVG